jgi:NADH dehydrogenase FAD-containing subunit
LAANRLRRKLGATHRVVLVAPEQALIHRVRLHQCAVHGTSVRQPYRRVLASGVEHVQARVVGLDARSSVVRLAADPQPGPLRFDALILAMGSALRPSLPCASRFALALSDDVRAQELAQALPSFASGSRVVVVGAGLTGIELATELAEAYPQLVVELVAERFAQGLLQGDPAAREHLLREVRALGVQVREGARVRALESSAVLLADGTRLECVASILACGMEACAAGLGGTLNTGRDGRVEVDEHLRVAGLERVLVAGDLAAPPASGIGSGLGTTRMACASAMPMGAHAADQVVRLFAGEPLQPFKFQYKLQCVSLGRKRGLVISVDGDDRPSGQLVSGYKAALIKEGICRMVIGALRLERMLPGAYMWPRPARAKQQARSETRQLGA